MADIGIKIDVESKEAEKRLNALEKDFKDLGATSEKAGKETSSGFKLMSVNAAVAGAAVAGVGAAILGAVNKASKLQDLETQFISFTGSAEAAREQVQRIADFSGQTPFKLEELSNANRTLLAFGSSTEESFVQLKQLGEVAAATGQNIGELSQIFGQIQVAGRLTGERFNQLAERSVNLGPVLAKSLGVAESEIRGLISAGKISAEEVSKAFATMTEGSGQFAGGMERLSKTFTGAKSTLSDNIDLLAASLGSKLLPAAVAVVEEMTNAVKVVNEFVKGLSEAEGSAIDEEIKKTQEALTELVEEYRQAQKSGKGFFESQAEYEEGLRNTEGAIKDQVALLKRLNKAREAEQQAAPAKADKIEKEKEDNKNTEEVSNAQKIADELYAIEQQKIANKAALGATENATIAEQLDAQREILLAKEQEKQIALLESQGLYEEAQLVQAEAQAEKLSEIKRRQEEEDLAAAKRARSDELNLEKITADAKAKFEKETWLQRAQTTQKGLAAIASLQYSGSKQAFEIGKAAAIAQALVSIPATAIEAYKSLAGIPVVGPGLGAAAAAAAVVAGTSRVNQIRSQQFTAFAEGGVVPGTGNTDSVPSLLTPGEVVVPKTKFKDISTSDDETVNILKSINSSIDSLIILQSQITDTATERESQSPIMVELSIDGEVLASRILELNQDNARIA